ncbi:MAG: hypothetical protein J4N93_03915 [Chloroflexi bacterium]|nr:hypothetical protein [Chloroflexota bacterium]MCI0785686.1 hypothetical protein [Chloroflexota bacterium]
MNRKSRVVLMMAVISLVMAIGLGLSFGPTTVQASHIKIFDMNDRNASKDFAGSGSGVSVVTGTNIDFRIEAHDLAPVDLYEVIVVIRKDGDSIAEQFAVITFEVISDLNGDLTFEKSNFNLEFLPAGKYRVDWILANPNATDTGRTNDGKALTARLGRDPLLSCAPATFVTVPE